MCVCVCVCVGGSVVRFSILFFVPRKLRGARERGELGVRGDREKHWPCGHNEDTCGVGEARPRAGRVRVSSTSPRRRPEASREKEVTNLAAQALKAETRG